MSDKTIFYTTVNVARNAFISFLGKNDKARKYIQDRGINVTTENTFGIGYAPNTGDFLREMTRCGFNSENLLNLGLLRMNEAGRIIFPMAMRLIFPIRDALGRSIAFGGRWFIDDNNDMPKYLNSAESPVYHKGEILYGLYEGLQAIRQKRRAILTEGYFDVITMHQAGFNETVGVCGTKITDYQIYLLKMLGINVHAMFDGDAAGHAASVRFEALAKKQNLKYKVHLLNGLDPADIITQHGIKTMNSILGEV